MADLEGDVVYPDPSIAINSHVPDADALRAEALADPDKDTVVVATRHDAHARQVQAALQAGKHVQVEIPLCDVLADGEKVVALQKQTGLVAMCGHTRRFNPSHQYEHKKIQAD